MKRISIIAGIITLVFLVGVLVGTSDAVWAQGQRGDHPGKGLWANLTEEQREAVQEKREEMRSQGATREEIHEAVAEMLKGYGIEMPEDWKGPRGFRGGFGPGPGGFWADLTDEQREAVQEKREEMRSQGATREEIHEAVAEMLKGYGVDLPEGWKAPRGFRGDFGPGPFGFCADLTDKQREAIHEKTKEMRDQDATREEIHEAVTEMLKGYGVDLPEDWKGPRGFRDGFGPGPGGFWADLTEEQREAIHDKIEEMRDQDATHEEIRDAVAEMLKGYGIDLPEDWKGPRGFRDGFGPGPGGFWADLTEEQREAIHEKIKEMRDQDATREEIHSAVAEMLKGYGIELPENWGEGRRGDRRHRCALTQEQREIIRNLADEQRQTVRKTIREMRKQGAACEEIQAAVVELLGGFGIESSEDSESTSSETAPAELQIEAQSYPNPFNPQTEIAYNLPQNSYVKLTIYNAQGQKVKSLVDEYQSAGPKKVIWDGCAEGGEKVASGVYLYRIEAGPHNVTNRMVLLK